MPYHYSNSIGPQSGNVQFPTAQTSHSKAQHAAIKQANYASNRHNVPAPGGFRYSRMDTLVSKMHPLARPIAAPFVALRVLELQAAKVDAQLTAGTAKWIRKMGLSSNPALLKAQHHWENRALEAKHRQHTAGASLLGKKHLAKSRDKADDARRAMLAKQQMPKFDRYKAAGPGQYKYSRFDTNISKMVRNPILAPLALGAATIRAAKWVATGIDAEINRAPIALGQELGILNGPKWEARRQFYESRKLKSFQKARMGTSAMLGKKELAKARAHADAEKVKLETKQMGRHWF
jgi:hypothetical protein